MGLDPALDSASHADDGVDGELKHSENLWPETAAWEGAAAFVRCQKGWGLADTTARGKSEILVGLIASNTRPADTKRGVVETGSIAVPALRPRPQHAGGLLRRQSDASHQVFTDGRPGILLQLCGSCTILRWAKISSTR